MNDNTTEVSKNDRELTMLLLRAFMEWEQKAGHHEDIGRWGWWFLPPDMNIGDVPTGEWTTCDADANSSDPKTILTFVHWPNFLDDDAASMALVDAVIEAKKCELSLYSPMMQPARRLGGKIRKEWWCWFGISDGGITYGRAQAKTRRRTIFEAAVRVAEQM